MADKGFVTLTIADYDTEVSLVAVACTALSAANWTAQSIARGLFISGVQGISKGLRVQQQYGNRNLENIGAAELPVAQRELKWLVQYHDTVTLARYTITVPCADVALLDPDNRPYALLSGGAMSFFVSQFNGFVLSPTGHAVVIDSIKLVGRAL